MSDYVHGYDPRERERLQDQAGTLVELLHHDTAYPDGSAVLEAGCGVGAQTVTLASRSPGLGSRPSTSRRSRSPRRASASRRRAWTTWSCARPTSSRCRSRPRRSTTSSSASCSSTSRGRPRRCRVLTALLKPGGTVTVIEGDHGSAYFHPDSPAAHEAIRCQVELQARAGGDALIGRQVYPLMVAAGLDAVRVSPRMVYADASRPGLVDGFTRRTFTAMIEGVRAPALAAGLIDAPSFDAGVEALHRTTGARRDLLLHVLQGHGRAALSYQTSPSRQSQASGRDGSSGTPAGSTKTEPSSSSVRTGPAAVSTEVGPASGSIRAPRRAAHRRPSRSARRRRSPRGSPAPAGPSPGRRARGAAGPDGPRRPRRSPSAAAARRSAGGAGPSTHGPRAPRPRRRARGGRPARSPSPGR